MPAAERAARDGGREAEAPPAGGPSPFAEGDRALLIDRKGRRYLVRLRSGRTFESHSGIVSHDALIGATEGTEVEARRNDSARRSNARYLAVRPTLSDVVLNMPRGAQVIYPKDLGAILLAADIFPGARVLEAGVGSGALSMTLLRAGARITGYEIRPDFAATAIANVTAMIGHAGSYEVHERDVYEGIAERDLDRVVLDLPEPWRVVPHAEAALRRGGILCAYLPSINQTAELREALAHSAFGLEETFEVLRRTWHIEGRSVRPDQRMVAHTGFITTARLLDASVRDGRRSGPEEAEDEPAADDGIDGRAVENPERLAGEQGGSSSARLSEAGRRRAQSPATMKMHSPGHSSAASVTASSRSAVTSAICADPPGLFRTAPSCFT
ncbi:MAG: tRNA (adenine-N1)-methyltransferase [Acidimicrobiales bacterium]